VYYRRFENLKSFLSDPTGSLIPSPNRGLCPITPALKGTISGSGTS
jgi:hypothetical protein